MQSFRFVKLAALSLTAVAALLALPTASEAHSQRWHHRHKASKHHAGHHAFPYWAWYAPFYAAQRHHRPSWHHRAPHYRSHCGQRFHSDDAYRRHMHRHHRPHRGHRGHYGR